MVGSKEIQAVVFAAGRGCRLTELTSGRPKCLLPVGQHPLLYHALLLLQKSGFKEAIVLVQGSALSQIQAALNRCDLSITSELVPVTNDEDSGTGDSLRWLYLQEKIRSDVLIMTCDLIASCDLKQLLQTFRQHHASLAALFFCPVEHPACSEPPPGLKTKIRSEKDIAGINLETNRLAMLASASDFEENVPLKRSLLRQHAKLSFRTDLTDAHVYIMSLPLVQYLARSSSFSAIKGEFVPFIVGKPKAERLDLESSLANDIGKIDLTSFNDHTGDLQPAYHSDTIRCYAVVAAPEEIGLRVNSIPSLWLANRMVANSLKVPINSGISQDPTSEVLTSQVEDSFIGANSLLKEKTAMRGSILGDSSSVQSRSRITKSIILRNVEIGAGCVLENCIIGSDVKLGDNTELRNCVVGSNVTVTTGTKATHQVLTHADRLMEI